VFAAAGTRVALAAVSIAALAVVSLAGAASGIPRWKHDVVPPTSPTNLHVRSASAHAVFVAWDPSSDDIGVAGYYVYGDRGRARVSGPGYTIDRLDCDETAVLAVAAFDRAGNRSDRVTGTVSTTTVRTPPRRPLRRGSSAGGRRMPSCCPGPSSDNVGVIAYRVYRNLARRIVRIPDGHADGAVVRTSTPYLIDAADAAGNQSLHGRFTSRPRRVQTLSLEPARGPEGDRPYVDSLQLAWWVDNDVGSPGTA
jgi:hypothetical protein